MQWLFCKIYNIVILIQRQQIIQNWAKSSRTKLHCIAKCSLYTGNHDLCTTWTPSVPTKTPCTPTKIILLNLFTFGVLHTCRLPKMTNMRCYSLSSHHTTSYLDPPLPWVPPPHRLNMAPQPCTEVAAMTKVRANTRCLILTSPSCSRHWVVRGLEHHETPAHGLPWLVVELPSLGSIACHPRQA